METVHWGGEMLARNEPAVTQENGALDRVPQLADVSGPRIGKQPLPRISRNSGRRAAHGLPKLFQERLGERKDILGAIAQRRDVDLEDVEPVVEVLAEGLPRDGGAQIPVRRGDDAPVRPQGPGAAQALGFALLKQVTEIRLPQRG